MSRIPVYDDDGNIVARVEFNNNLDYWDGHNYSCGSMGEHLGITRLKDGRFVIINGTDWQGQRDTAHIASKEDALAAVIRSGNEELMQKYFAAEVKKLDEQEEE